MAAAVDADLIKAAAAVMGAHRAPPLTRERRRQLKLESIDRERIFIWKTLWAQLGNIRGDPREYIERVWARKLPKMYERLLAAAMAGEKVDAALDILKAMTVVTRTLAPSANKSLPVDPAVLGLPSDADLSHLSDEDLARVLRRPLPGPDVGKPARKPRRKALPQPDVPMGGLGDDDDEIRSGNQHRRETSQDGTVHTHELKSGKGGKKKNNAAI